MSTSSASADAAKSAADGSIWAWLLESAPVLALLLAVLTAVLGGLYYYRGGFRPAVWAQIDRARSRLKVRVLNRGRTEGGVPELRVLAGDRVVQDLVVYPFGGTYVPQTLAPHEDMLLIIERGDEQIFGADVRVSVRFGASTKARTFTPKPVDGGFQSGQAHVPGGE